MSSPASFRIRWRRATSSSGWGTSGRIRKTHGQAIWSSTASSLCATPGRRLRESEGSGHSRGGTAHTPGRSKRTYGWGRRIRTPTNGSRARRPTVRRSPSDALIILIIRVLVSPGQLRGAGGGGTQAGDHALPTQQFHQLEQARTGGLAGECHPHRVDDLAAVDALFLRQTTHGGLR